MRRWRRYGRDDRRSRTLVQIRSSRNDAVGCHPGRPGSWQRRASACVRRRCERMAFRATVKQGGAAEAVNVNQRGRILHATGGFLRSRSTPSAYFRFTSTPAVRLMFYFGVSAHVPTLTTRLIAISSEPKAERIRREGGPTPPDAIDFFSGDGVPVVGARSKCGPIVVLRDRD